MASFLVIIDSDEKIVEVFWSDPIYLISRQNSSFIELFKDEDQGKVRRMLEKSAFEKDVFQCNTSLSLISNETPVRICLLSIEGEMLVFASDMQIFENDEIFMQQRVIIHRFMHTVKNFADKKQLHNTKAISLQFERIQKLNNELINTKRMLEKANTQMNMLNRDLNNRLVKDSLTGLVSRYQYRAEIDELILKNPGKTGLFLFIDIDDFKAVNDNFGHMLGDKYLIEFAQRLRSLTIHQSIKIRIAGDEFGLFIYGLNKNVSALIEDVWKQIHLHVLSGPIILECIAVTISISAGVAIYGQDTTDVYDLIEYADYAMYVAKRKGKNCFSVFDKAEYQQLKR